MLVTGRALAAERKAAGMNQTQLAEKAGIARCTVSYWENKTLLDLQGWAVRRMLDALGIPHLKDFSPPKRARNHGFNGAIFGAEVVVQLFEVDHRPLQAKLSLDDRLTGTPRNRDICPPLVPQWPNFETAREQKIPCFLM